MTFWMAVQLLSGVTYFTRSLFVLTLADSELPPLLLTALRYVAPATLSALVASLLVGDNGVKGLGPSPELVALVVGALVAWKWRRAELTLALGMVTLWLSLWLWP